MKVKIFCFPAWSGSSGNEEREQVEREINTLLASDVKIIRLLQSSGGNFVSTTVTIFYEEKK